MKTYDFIIGYEHKNREIESICLLKCELENRGYSVYIYNTNDSRLKEHIHKFHAKVLLIPYAYDNRVVSFCVGKAITFDKLINLQWEQAIYKQQEDNGDSFRSPSGICKQAVHFSWGKANVKRLCEIVGLDKKNVELVGNMTLDFLKKPLSTYYLSKEELYKKYNIPQDKKVCLFISSFKSATLSSEALEAWCKQYGEWRRAQHVVALKTLKTVLAWIKKALENDPELVFIFRPHPGEGTELADCLAKECERFIVIKDLSVKQWIVAADKIYTWLSTTVVEVYFAGKDCSIVYPYDVPKEAEARLFDEADVIRTYPEFENTFGTKLTFPIKLDRLNDYYMTDEGMSYIRAAGVCEKVLADETYLIDNEALSDVYSVNWQRSSFFKKIKIYLWQIDWFYECFWKVTQNKLKNNRYINEKRIARDEYELWKKEEYVSNEEIEKISEKIRRCLEQSELINS